MTTHHHPPQILGKPVSRRTLLRTGGAFAGALGTLSLLEELAIVPQRVAWADEPVDSLAFPDVQFELGPFMPPAQTIDGVAVAMPPVHTVFVTARLSRAPSKADAVRMEGALRRIETTYPYAPGGVFTHVAYSVNYFARLPSTLVNANIPRTIAFKGQVANRPCAATARRSSATW